MPRKEHKYYFIYKTTNILNGKYYYGMHCTSNLDDGYLGSGKRLRYSINKYGEENHKREILEFLPDRKTLALREREIVNLNEIAKNDCMNLIIGGEGGGGFSIEQQRKNAIKSNISQKILKLQNPEWYKQRCINSSLGQKKSYATGKRPKVFSYDWTGRKHREETKRKIGLTNSIKQSGTRNSRYNTKWIYNLNLKKSTSVKLEELQKYLDQGWNFGRRFNFE